ncbi:MAG: UDP-glucose 6-dehydrogenase [Candidatus Levybacteria bacterium RIFCSPHIGHO2_02_FULL_37_13]|nr:MAG: UDP-glucose 6-dehydrogenase [Candidatus Levybacteria bacterium RIFCSPHIGHO2_02_FULL_37_13]OGH37327.1 MAG: UDP-glucose 6-dehydrogenase [Candidatus Levybacteria bacterium RIFCSPLOWO2_01_FULL_37_26]
MTITFIGHGYVGLVTASVFADLGNKVWVIGHTKEKIENLKKGIIPIYEPGLAEIVERNIKAKRLLFTLDYKEAIPESKIVFIAVGTPPKENGEADLSVVLDVAKKIAKHLGRYTVVVTKSTVPVGTYKKIKTIIEKDKLGTSSFDVASIPEFLREGQAISDTLHPDRIVIGTESQKAQDLLVELHKPIDGNYVLTNIETAEVIKYASNAFLATKISFANAIAYFSELTGADGLSVLKGIGLDKRIGREFLNAGAGYGGSCFPKDVKALIAIAHAYGYDFDLLRDVEKINRNAILNIVSKAKKLLGGNIQNKKIGILGLAFKPDTDDMRDAPSIVIINKLLENKAKIKAYDPVSVKNAKKILRNVEFVNNSYDVAHDSDLLIVLTEWNEFRQLDLQKIKKLMKKPLLLDGRNIYDPKIMEELGFSYMGVGR